MTKKEAKELEALISENIKYKKMLKDIEKDVSNWYYSISSAYEFIQLRDKIRLFLNK